MAITIIKEPTGIYPAYNESWIQFTSDLVGNNRAEITLLPSSIFPNPFTVFPDLDGVYTFNLRELVQILLNKDGFKDQETAFPVDWGYSYPYGYLSQMITITVLDGIGGSDIVTPTYNFIKGVKQIGEQVFPNTTQVMNTSEDGVNYNLTYWEGFPFSFELQRVLVAETVTVKNLNSGDTSAILTATSSDTFRLYVDKGTSNWTTSGFLPLSDTINRLEVRLNGTFKTNVRLKKNIEKQGVYLKWLNNDGGFSYWLFDKFHKFGVSAGSMGEIKNNLFENVGTLSAPTSTLGREVKESYKLKTTVDREESKLLKSLYSSPSVQMYSSQLPYIGGDWIDVRANSGLDISNKKDQNEISLTIELPNPITMKL